MTTNDELTLDQHCDRLRDAFAALDAAETVEQLRPLLGVAISAQLAIIPELDALIPIEDECFDD